MPLRPRRTVRWAVPVAATVLIAALSVVLVLTARRHCEPTASPPPATTSSSSSSSASSSAPSSSPRPTTTTAARSKPTTAPGTTAPPSPTVPPGLRGREVTVLPTTRHVVALTFDAGGDAGGLASILATLSAQQVRATFFLTGRWTADHPDAVRAILASGSRIGNHTVTHPHLPALSDAQLRAEVLGAQATIRAAGADPRPLFRFPFGDRDARTIADVNALGYVPVGWTVDTLGWEGTAGGMSAQRVADRALAMLRPGEIVLMHVGANPDDATTFDADALPGTIARMRAAGYDFVTLDALLAP